MRIVQVNLAADPAIADPESLLDRYHTLTGWSRALARAGADVWVVQRFSRNLVTKRDGVGYEFIADGASGMPAPWAKFRRMIEAVRRAEPDVVHVNGLMFPGMTIGLRNALGEKRIIVLQDHSGALPQRHRWPIASIQSVRWSRAFRAADAVSFTAPELASRWCHVGLPHDLQVLAIPEASTDFTPLDHADARRRTGITGAPAVLWVGRLNANKDPQTVLSAIERITSRLPTLHLWMIVPPAAAEREIRRRIDDSATLGQHVTLAGSIEHRDMPVHYSSADVFVSGSRHEGSGYALIESMACGVLPCVTDIPAFRALTHGCGEVWPPGDADGCAAALLKAANRVSPGERSAVRAVFTRQLSWDVLGRQTIAAYQRLMDAAARR